MAGYSQLSSAVGAALGNLNLPGGLGGALTPNAANTTTAVNLVIIVNGQVQGLVRSMSIDEQFNTQRVKAIGSAVNVALLPGVYEATGSITKAFIFGTTLENAFGGGIRPVVGQYLASPDFSKFYFNIAEVASNGSILAVYHDCVLTSLRRAVEIDQVVITEDASILVRWTAAS